MIPQKLRILLVGFLISVAVGQTTPQYRIDYENLPQEKRDEFYKHVVEAKRLFSQQRIFEALDTIGTAEQILPNFPAVMSIKGACYVEFRDFPSAEAVFQKTLTMAPDNYGILFNIGEINFVQGNWTKSKQYFNKVHAALGSAPMNPTFLITELKIYIADKKLNNTAATSKIENKYDFTFDSPIYYYINAVKEFESNNNNEAQLWLLRARRVFTKQGQLDAWHDCLVESGYIKSFYGGGDRNELDIKLDGGGDPEASGLNLNPIQ